MAAQELGPAGDALGLRKLRLHIGQSDQFVEMGMQRLSGLCLDATAKSDDALAESAGNSSYPDGSFALECLPVKAPFAGEYQIRTSDGSF